LRALVGEIECDTADGRGGWPRPRHSAVAAKRAIVGLALAMGASSPALAADAAMPTKAPKVVATASSNDGSWQITYDEDTRYLSWQSTRGYPNTVTSPPLPPTMPGSGTQVYTPVGLGIVGRPNDDFKVELLTRSGYVWSRQSTPGATGEVSTTTDTSVTGKVSYLGLTGAQPFLSVAVNAPTGKTVLLGNSAFARLDPDLVDLPTFGEGWNVGPTVGIMVALGDSALMSVGLGYTHRGAYDREGAIDPVTFLQGTTRIGPGSQLTPNVTVGYHNNNFLIQSSLSYVIETVTQLDGADFYRSGDRYLAALSTSYGWTESLTSTLTGQFAHSRPNKVAILGLPDLVSEAFDSNSSVYKAVLDLTYKQGDLAIGPTGSFMYRDHNAWSSTAFQFLPAKTRWSAGAAAGYAVTKQLTLTARAERLWTHEAENGQKLAEDMVIPNSAVPAISSTGWLLSLGGKAQF
jgi:opacity protein-like surface antigen